MAVILSKMCLADFCSHVWYFFISLFGCLWLQNFNNYSEDFSVSKEITNYVNEQTITGEEKKCVLFLAREVADYYLCNIIMNNLL